MLLYEAPHHMNSTSSPSSSIGTWLANPSAGLRGLPDNTHFYLGRAGSPRVHLCRLVGNLPSDSSVKAERLTDLKILRLERLGGDALYCVAQIPSDDLRSCLEIVMGAKSSKAVEEHSTFVRLLEEPGAPKSHSYDIEHERMDSAAKVLAWVHHLCSKDWVTNQHIQEFLDVAERRGVKIDHAC